LVENKDTKSKEGNTSRDESNLDKRQLLPTPFSFLLGLNLKDAFPAWKTCVTFVYLDKKIPVTAQNGGFMYIEQGILGPEREKKNNFWGNAVHRLRNNPVLKLSARIHAQQSVVQVFP
jgi:hypothetical protein